MMGTGGQNRNVRKNENIANFLHKPSATLNSEDLLLSCFAANSAPEMTDQMDRVISVSAGEEKGWRPFILQTPKHQNKQL